MITAIVIPADPDEPLRLEHLDNRDLSAYRRLVAGDLEHLDLERPHASIYLNEEGKVLGLPSNPRATALLWVHNSRFRGRDVVAGPAFIVGPDDPEGDDTSAPDDLIDLLFERCSQCGAHIYPAAEGTVPSSSGVCTSGQPHIVHPERRPRYRVQVLTRSETTWSGNDVEFGDWFDAYLNAILLAQRWTLVREVRVVPVLDEELLETWYQLGLESRSIKAATKPTFSRHSFIGCYSIEELADRLTAASWSVGAAFYYRDLCFIAQVNDGDEWLAIRHGIAFETLALKSGIEDGTFASLVRRLLIASKEQCQQRTY